MGLITTVVFLVATVCGSIFVDVNIHENDFSKSVTGQTLKGYGGYEFGLFAYESSCDAAKWVKDNAPEYLEAARVWSKPYVRLLTDLGLVTFNVTSRIFNNITSYISEQYPVAQYWYVYYFGFCFLPGPIAGVIQGHSLIVHMNSILPPTKMRKNLPGVRDAAYNAAMAVVGVAHNGTHNMAQYLQKNVFFESWSAENLLNMTAEAYSYTTSRIYEIFNSPGK